MKNDPLPSPIRKKIEGAQNLQDKMALARQFYPSQKELIKTAGFSDNPLHETRAHKIEANPYFIHKYSQKLLILASTRCAALCRFCTRKRVTQFNKTTIPRRIGKMSDTISRYLPTHPEITELIFSGGDPFVEPPTGIAALLNTIGALPQIEKIRFHSRTPIVDPRRMNKLGWLEALEKIAANQKKVTLVLHINHPAELSPDVTEQIKIFNKMGIEVKSQSVLLRRVNDSAQTLERLFRALLQNRVKPYYLHQLDRVTGSAHFEVPHLRGLQIMEHLKGRFHPNDLPRYVVDTNGGKIDVADYISSLEGEAVGRGDDGDPGVSSTPFSISGAATPGASTSDASTSDASKSRLS